MQIHKIKKPLNKKTKKRVGRGGKRGTYSGKGLKGQKSRAGGKKFQPIIRLFVKRYPKKKGYRFKSIKIKPAVVNISLLERRFQSDSEISPKTLLEAKLISKIKGKMPKIKILGRGDLTKSFVIKDCEVSESAKEKIQKAGGKINLKPTV